MSPVKATGFHFSVELLDCLLRHLKHHGIWWVPLLRSWDSSFPLYSFNRGIRVSSVKGLKPLPCLSVIRNRFYPILGNLHFYLDLLNLSQIRRYCFCSCDGLIGVSLLSSESIGSWKDGWLYTVITLFYIYCLSLMFFNPSHIIMFVLIMGTILQPLQTTSSHHTATVTTTVSSSPGFLRARSATPAGKMNEWMLYYRVCSFTGSLFSSHPFG